LEDFFLGVAWTLGMALIAAVVLVGRATLASIDAWEKGLRKPRAGHRRPAHN